MAINATERESDWPSPIESDLSKESAKSQADASTQESAGSSSSTSGNSSRTTSCLWEQIQTLEDQLSRERFLRQQRAVLRRGLDESLRSLRQETADEMHQLA